MQLNGLYNRLAIRVLEEQEEADNAGLDQYGRPKTFIPRNPLPGEKTTEAQKRQIPTEVYMRRKELLDDVQSVIDIVDPGVSRRRGTHIL